MSLATSITCPRCGMTSHHPKDVEQGYCGACHFWTGDARMREAGAWDAITNFVLPEFVGIIACPHCGTRSCRQPDASGAPGICANTGLAVFASDLRKVALTTGHALRIPSPGEALMAAASQPPLGMESHTVAAPPVGTYVRPLVGAQADGVVTGEGWVWGVGELGGEPLVQTVVLVAREPRLGSIPVRDVDPQSLGPVNRAQVRKVCRALHRFLGEGGGKTRGGDFTPYEAAVALALRPLEDVIL